MDQYNVEKAILTTINRTRYHERQREVASSVSKGDKITEFMGDFKKLMNNGQLDHTDVKEVVKKAPDRFFKFFWFNPNMDPERQEEDYKILENHFKEGFCGVKIHSGFHSIKVPKDIQN